VALPHLHEVLAGRERRLRVGGPLAVARDAALVLKSAVNVETITTKRGKSVAPTAIDGMVSPTGQLDYHSLLTREEPAGGTMGVPRFLAIFSNSTTR
jgi:hypothetical protein